MPLPRSSLESVHVSREALIGDHSQTVEVPLISRRYDIFIFQCRGLRYWEGVMARTARRSSETFGSDFFLNETDDHWRVSTQLPR